MKFIITITALVFALPVHSYAWGKKGHHIVADIAYHLLDSATRALCMANIYKLMLGLLLFLV